jgi:hypothetical protein
MALEAGAAVEDDSVTQLKSTEPGFSKPERIHESTPDGVDTTQHLPKPFLACHAECLLTQVGVRKHKYASEP